MLAYIRNTSKYITIEPGNQILNQFTVGSRRYVRFRERRICPAASAWRDERTFRQRYEEEGRGTVGSARLQQAGSVDR
jgi:hypothetical protein